MNDGIFTYIQEGLKQIKDQYLELDIIKVNHNVDNMHILAVIPPRMSVSEIMRIIKSNTTKVIKRKEVQFFKRRVLTGVKVKYSLINILYLL